jgi:hypothetical protein
MKIRLMESERSGMERKNPNLGELEWSLAPTHSTEGRGFGRNVVAGLGHRHLS